MKPKSWSLITVIILPILALIFVFSLVTPAYAINYTVGVDCSTIQECINLAGPGDTVIVPAGIYNEGLTLSSPISLTGVSSATTIIQALSGQRVLTVAGATIDNNVVISGLTFSGGDVSGGNICFSGDTTNCGGGILLTNNAQPTIQSVIIENSNAYRGGGLYANETGGLLLDHVIFRNNSVILTGGGLDARNMPITVTNSLFQQNTTINNVGGALRAGANFGVVAPVFISNTTFLSNTAQCGGSICEAPAVYLFDQDAQIIDSHFEGNSCTDSDCDGGGVYMSASFNNPSLSLVNTDFINNTAGGGGGGVSVGNLAQMAVVNGRFENNRALSGEGGGLDHSNFLLAANSTISGTQFISNSAALDGGGLYSVSDIAITNATFERNSSGEDGGGLFIDFGGAGSSLTNTEFISNTAEMNGGGAYVSVGDVQVTSGRFERNRANGPENDGGLLTTENGGGGLWAGANLTLTGTEFISNVAETNGGGAHVRGNAILNGGQFEQNQSLGNFFSSPSYGGGGLYVVATLSFTDTTFTSNQAAFFGGGVWASQEVSGVNGLFQNNNSNSSGGGLFASSNLTLSSTQLINNEAELRGGGAFVNGVANLTETLFQANRVVSTTFSSGGGLAASEGFTATNTQFIGNTTTGSGGGAFAFGPVTLFSSRFQDNESGSSGGGLLASFDPVVSINTSFVNNTAGVNGGGLSTNGNIYLTDSLIQYNNAITNGGGLNTSGSLFFTNTQIISNSAGEDGGGVWANSQLNGTNGRIENNSSGGSGGGYYGRLAQLYLNGTVFANNQAGENGGGAYAFDGRAVDKALFEGNTATGAGGGLFLQRFVHISATQFLGNAADLGGGLAISRTNTGAAVQFVHNSLFARNTATTNGAGIYYNQPRPVDLIHNTIASPSAASGAAIHVVTGTVNITNNIIANHTTGIEVVGGAVTENYSLFSGNVANTSGVVGGGVGSLTGNPAFQDPANDDYHLTSASQAIDLGVDAGINVDFENDPRPGIGGFDVGFDETAFAPILSVSKMATPANDAPYHGEIVYTVVLSNSGDLAAVNTVLADTLPAEVDFGHFIQSNGATVNNDEITWSGTVPINTSLTFSFVVSHTGNYEDVFTNTVEFGHAAGNSSGAASAVVAVEPRTADLLISKSSVRDENAGVISYTIVVQNLGPADASGTGVFDTIPAGISAFNWQCIATGGASCTANGIGDINDTLTNFPVGSQVVYSVAATMVTTDVTVVNTAEIIPPLGLTNLAPTNSAINTSASTTGNIFLPLVFKSDSPAPGPGLLAPDLIVDSLVASSNAVTVVIKNVGNAPVVDAFWVDAYINPVTPPTRVNQIWEDLGDQGIAWGVTDAIPVNGIITLTLGSVYYDPGESNFTSPLTIGTSVWAQVDSVNLLTTYGGVLESHELVGGTYNNIANTLSVAGSSVALSATAEETSSSLSDHLPSRRSIPLK